MKQCSLLLLFSLFIWNCSEKKSNPKSSKQEVIEAQTTDIKIDTSQSIKKLKSENAIPHVETNSNEPCKELIEFVAEIEKSNWVSDTNRLKEVTIYSDLVRENVTYFNERPFYPITFEKSDIYYAYTSKPYTGYLDSLELKKFSRVKNIWGYFYRNKEATDLISDGVIEQWKFETEEEAEQALKQISQASDIIYFNTNPYFTRIGNKLIIFSSRAMAFSYDQKPLFEIFIKNKSADFRQE